MTLRAKRLLLALAVLAGLSLGACAPWDSAPWNATTPAAPSAPAATPKAASDCQEDEPCWDCATMGNHICGPLQDDYISPPDYTTKRNSPAPIATTQPLARPATPAPVPAVARKAAPATPTSTPPAPAPKPHLAPAVKVTAPPTAHASPAPTHPYTRPTSSPQYQHMTIKQANRASHWITGCQAWTEESARQECVDEWRHAVEDDNLVMNPPY